MTLSQRSPVSISFIVITAFVAEMPAAAQCNSNDAGAPCFAGNPDILGGRASLLQNDDLVFNTLTFNGSGGSPAGGNLLTSNSTITQTSETQITAANTNNNGLSNTITVKGRLFNVNHDQILSAALVQNPGGQQNGVATLEGNDSSMTVPPLAVLNFGQTLYGTSGNFLGGGFDQMLIAAVNSSGQVYFQVLAAADPANTTSGLVAGPVSAPVATSATVFAVTAGVFTDPQAEVPRPPAQIALMSASPNTTGGIVVTFYAVDSKLNVSPTGKSLNVTLPPNTSPITAAIAAGRFSGGTHDQLAIAYPYLMLTPWEFRR
jgi:hypothetical protein